MPRVQVLPWDGALVWGSAATFWLQPWPDVSCWISKTVPVPPHQQVLSPQGISLCCLQTKILPQLLPTWCWRRA